MYDHDHRETAPIQIPPYRLARWLEAANHIGEVGGALRVEVLSLYQDPSRHMLMRAAKAARYAERMTTGDAQAIANATATELENAAA